MLKIVNTSFSYGSLSPYIIRDCSAEFESPGVSLISGSNGCGKSTLMDIMTGFKSPHAGNVFINNVNVYSSQKSVSTLRKIISYMPSSLRMPLYLDVSYLLNLWMGNLYKSELITMLKLSPFMDHKYYSLSDGYRNRVHLAIALSRGSFVFLDEPLKSQDEDLKKIFSDIITMSSKGRTFIITTPDNIDGLKHSKKLVLSRGVLSEA
ncbi:MAG: ATP-binding cassette domain-containing protein [bacterium]